MRKLLLVLSLFIVSSSGLSAAEFYVGAGLGEEVVGGQFAQPLQEFGVQAADNGVKVFGGVTLTEFLGVEASYYDFGARTCCPGLADAGFETELDGFAATLVGRLPLGASENFELFAKAGALFWEEKGIEISFTGPRPLSADGQDLALGAGVRWRVARKLSLVAEWEAFDVGGDTIDGLWLSVRVDF